MSKRKDRPVKGRGKCPVCGCRKVVRVDSNMEFYGPEVEVCKNCEAIWEPLPDVERVKDDDGTPFSFPEPCNNCAFRPGSPEQQDPEKWKDLINQLKKGARFYCHKGVPVAPTTEDGFAYPKKKCPKASAEAGQDVHIHDERRMRLCRGFLNMYFRHVKKEYPDDIET